MDQNQDIIRSPDESKREILINNNKLMNEDEELNSVLLQSLQEEEEFCDMQINNMIEQVKNRTKLFEHFVFTIKRIGVFDKNIQEIYELIEYVIDSYCCGNIENYKYDKITYNKIFETLSKIRFSEFEINLLKSVILQE